jgi:glycosyltransferase involved in cell wall biosynthesis
LSRQVPLVLTLHDAWLLSGHCAQSIDCHRWLSGCGHCPDLTLYPAIRRDNTAANFNRKRSIFTGTRAYVSAPSAWLLDRARRSHLAGSMVEGRVMPNGVDMRLFAPGARDEARALLGLGVDARVLLFVAARGAANSWKDFNTLRAAVAQLANDSSIGPVVCLVLGHSRPSEKVGGVEFRYLGAEADRRRVARVYRAADLYVHATRADTFPLTILEALASAIPVVASAAGGIPEQIRHLPIEGLPDPPRAAVSSADQASGTLVPVGDVAAMSKAISTLLGDVPLLTRLGANARRDAVARFSQELMIDRWLAWYAQILAA